MIKARVVAKTDYDIPRFGIKSSLILILSGVVSTLILPFLLSLIGVDKSISVVIGNTFILGFALAYSRFFIETKRGICKRFWQTYIGFGSAFLVISFFWMYLQIYI